MKSCNNVIRFGGVFLLLTALTQTAIIWLAFDLPLWALLVPLPPVATLIDQVFGVGSTLEVITVLEYVRTQFELATLVCLFVHALETTRPDARTTRKLTQMTFK